MRAVALQLSQPGPLGGPRRPGAVSRQLVSEASGVEFVGGPLSALPRLGEGLGRAALEPRPEQGVLGPLECPVELRDVPSQLDAHLDGLVRRPVASLGVTAFSCHLKRRRRDPAPASESRRGFVRCPQPPPLPFGPSRRRLAGKRRPNSAIAAAVATRAPTIASEAWPRSPPMRPLLGSKRRGSRFGNQDSMSERMRSAQPEFRGSKGRIGSRARVSVSLPPLGISRGDDAAHLCSGDS